MKDLEVRLEKFLTLALKSTPQPKLFDIYVSFLIFNTLNFKGCCNLFRIVAILQFRCPCIDHELLYTKFQMLHVVHRDSFKSTCTFAVSTGT